MTIYFDSEAHTPDFNLNGSFVKDLGVKIDPQGHINALPLFFSTSKSVLTAMIMGFLGVAALGQTLQEEVDVEE